jgi:phosphate transport system substrate-binding protein
MESIMVFLLRTFRPMAGLLASVALASLATATQAADITGAGATFPYAVYSKWAEAYRAATGNRVNYQGIGSAGGIKQIKARTVDFGGTDMPLSQIELDASGLVQFPTVVGAVTVVVNLPGIKSGELKLDGATLARVFGGLVTQWNHADIAAQNPGLKLPALPITLANRSDGSGTTYVFTSYLARQSPQFKRTVGVGTSVNWPVNSVGGKGNPGVAASVRKIRGTIGYVDIADAIKNNMTLVALRNKAGLYIVPNQKSLADTVDGAEFKSKGLIPDLLDQSHANAWPITSATYILAYAKGEDAGKRQDVVDFFKWSLMNGRAMAEEIGFVPLPEHVVRMVETELAKIR